MINKLCLAGGVALNCVANGKIVKEKIFENIWIQPASGDAGGSLGGALYYWFAEKKISNIGKFDTMNGSHLGPQFSNSEIKKSLTTLGANYNFFKDDDLIEKISDDLSNQKIIGWFQGRMEFGPRALGARSIIADPRDKNMQKKMNLKIKFRESFRPFAPSILKENIKDFFDLKLDSPYMLITSDIKENKRLGENELKNIEGFDKLKIKKSDLPAVTHVDYSARIQTIDEIRNPKFFNLIKFFKKKTNCPAIINTSFNIRGEPIVCTPEDAFRCFMNTEMDILVLENYVLEKKNQELIKHKNYKEKYLND